VLILDTCVIVFDALAPERLSAAAAAAIEKEELEGVLACSDISLWEIAMLVEHGRLSAGTDVEDFIRLALAARSIAVLPISPAIACRSTVVPIHRDPADRIIAATAIVNECRLVTADEALRSSRAVPTLW